MEAHARPLGIKSRQRPTIRADHPLMKTPLTTSCPWKDHENPDAHHDDQHEFIVCRLAIKKDQRTNNSAYKDLAISPSEMPAHPKRSQRKEGQFAVQRSRFYALRACGGRKISRHSESATNRSNACAVSMNSSRAISLTPTAAGRSTRLVE